MQVGDLFKLSLFSLLAYRLRSALTILGIVVGIGSVVLLTSIGEGVRLFVLSEFTQFGTNLIAVTPGKTTTFGISGATISTVRPLSLDDAQAISKLDNILDVVPVIQGNAGVEFQSRERRTMVLGVGPGVPEVWKMPLASGRFLPADGYQSSRPFAVLGSKMRDELFRHQNPLGQRVRIGGDRYRVIGVMAPKGQMLGFDLDDTIYIPADKSMEMFDRESLMEIDILYKAGIEAEHVADNIKRLLIARHGDEDFTIITQDKMLEVLGTILDVLTLGVAAIGAISLVVGAVGIMTIMTIAVTERTSEVGLLRAMGATQGHILQLFLAEAMLLSLLGGMIGTLAAVIIVFMTNVFVPTLPLEIALEYVLAALVFSLLIGLLAGIAPALRASRLHPLEALRTE